jgi:type II secretion system-associated lipoprotein
MQGKNALSLCLVVLFLSCSGFIREDDMKRIRRLEQFTFIVKKDFVVGDRRLRKGQRIRLHCKADDRWVKVYGYPAEQDYLQADPILIEYLFPDDFRKSKYDHEYFIRKMCDVIVLPSDQLTAKKKINGKNK